MQIFFCCYFLKDTLCIRRLDTITDRTVATHDGCSWILSLETLMKRRQFLIGFSSVYKFFVLQNTKCHQYLLKHHEQWDFLCQLKKLHVNIPEGREESFARSTRLWNILEHGAVHPRCAHKMLLAFAEIEIRAHFKVYPKSILLSQFTLHYIDKGLDNHYQMTLSPLLFESWVISKTYQYVA